MASEGLLDYTITEFECDSTCGHCGQKDCVWYDNFLDEEEEVEE